MATDCFLTFHSSFNPQHSDLSLHHCILVAKSSQRLCLKCISLACIKSVSPNSLPCLFIAVQSLFRVFLVYLLFKYFLFVRVLLTAIFLTLHILPGWSHPCLQFSLTSTRPFLLTYTHITSFNQYQFLSAYHVPRAMTDPLDLFSPLI